MSSFRTADSQKKHISIKRAIISHFEDLAMDLEYEDGIGNGKDYVHEFCLEYASFELQSEGVLSGSNIDKFEEIRRDITKKCDIVDLKVGRDDIKKFAFDHIVKWANGGIVVFYGTPIQWSEMSHRHRGTLRRAEEFMKNEDDCDGQSRRPELLDNDDLDWFPRDDNEKARGPIALSDTSSYHSYDTSSDDWSSSIASFDTDSVTRSQSGDNSSVSSVAFWSRSLDEKRTFSFTSVDGSRSTLLSEPDYDKYKAGMSGNNMNFSLVNNEEGVASTSVGATRNPLKKALKKMSENLQSLIYNKYEDSSD